MTVYVDDMRARRARRILPPPHKLLRTTMVTYVRDTATLTIDCTDRSATVDVPPPEIRDMDRPIQHSRAELIAIILAKEAAALMQLSTPDLFRRAHLS